MQHPQHSHQSLSSDPGYPMGAARGNDSEHYAENIPLKSHATPMPAEWMQQPTHYPPSPDGGEPVGARRGRGKKRFCTKKLAWVTYLLTTVQIVVFIVELVKNGMPPCLSPVPGLSCPGDPGEFWYPEQNETNGIAQFTGSPIETKPTFNPMIGPSPYVQIYMGARYVPCMKNIEGIQNSPNTISWNCPNSTVLDPMDPSNGCSLSETCGFRGVPNPRAGGSIHDQPEPDQWFRFIIPMFLHGGFVHIGFNLIVQMTMGVDMERIIGWWRYGLVYLASGIFGFVFGGNYAGQANVSTGCSGALFGILALFILDLLYNWKDRPSPLVELVIMILGVGISFVLGLLPGLDNFSHIGGFIMGLALGLTIMRSPNALRERIGLARNPYVAMSGGAGVGPDDNKATSPGPNFVDYLKGRRNMADRNHASAGAGAGAASASASNPLNFFKGRKPLWWAWWLVRAGALVAVLVGFILLIVNFYKYPKSNCDWCYRLSCLVSCPPCLVYSVSTV